MPRGKVIDVKYVMGVSVHRHLDTQLWRWSTKVNRWSWRVGGEIFREGLTGANMPSGMLAGGFLEAIAQTVGYDQAVSDARYATEPAIDVVEEGGAAAPTEK